MIEHHNLRCYKMYVSGFRVKKVSIDLFSLLPQRGGELLPHDGEKVSCGIIKTGTALRTYCTLLHHGQ